MTPEDLVVWLDSFDAAAGGPRPGLLCLRHANSMVVPVGWTLDDRREPVPRLFRPPVAQTAERDPSGPMRRPRRHVVETPELFDRDEPGGEGASPAADGVGEDPEGVAAVSWSPQFDQDDDLDGLLHADTPLLARAFRTGGRPRK